MRYKFFPLFLLTLLLCSSSALAVGTDNYAFTIGGVVGAFIIGLALIIVGMNLVETAWWMKWFMLLVFFWVFTVSIPIMTEVVTLTSIVAFDNLQTMLDGLYQYSMYISLFMTFLFFLEVISHLLMYIADWKKVKVDKNEEIYGNQDNEGEH